MTDTLNLDTESQIIEDDIKYTPKALPLIYWPDDRLNTPTELVSVFGKELKELISDLFFTMKLNAGVGLAANQCGVNASVITVWIEQDNPMVLINPTITESSEELFEYEEGCLSVPGYFDKRNRAETITVKFKNDEGVEKEIEVRGLYAFVIQHEIDHLNGKTFVDDLSFFKKSRVSNKVKKTLRKQTV